ncbi:MAG: hypothetical protein JWO71_577 [Candidatus Acidoferrum typicum]|jgi:hypothetical protein|nr:hypothetical protein [Candidatus Acidoferrum typicum]
MLRALKLVVLFGLLTILSFAQVPTAPPRSPKDVVAEFWKMETDGGRLTPDGWYKASKFFVRSTPPPLNKVVHVIRSREADSVEETARAENWTEVSVTTNEVGQLDSSLHFRPSLKRGEHGVLLLKGPVVRFALVLTDKHWELGSDGARGKESTGPAQWLIDCTENASWVNLETAKRYVTSVRDKTIDPAVKRNAEATIATLKSLNE